MTEPHLPLMIELSVPVGVKPDDVFRACMPIYPNGRPTLDLLEEAIRMLAEQAIDALRKAERLREDA